MQKWSTEKCLSLGRWNLKSELKATYLSILKSTFLYQAADIISGDIVFVNVWCSLYGNHGEYRDKWK